MHEVDGIQHFDPGVETWNMTTGEHQVEPFPCSCFHVGGPFYGLMVDQDGKLVDRYVTYVDGIQDKQ